MSRGDGKLSSAVAHAIRGRCTSKMLAEEPLPVSDRREAVEALLELAGWAPFHRPCDRSHMDSEGLSSMVPWRFHAVDAAGCRVLREALLGRGAGKIPGMLAAADALIQVTWLPNPGPVPEGGVYAPTLENMEHIAAASAAVQNLLVAATADGFATYWSSGGVLREEEVLGWLGIPPGEILLGAVFLFPPDPDGVTINPGKLREKRGAPGDWSRWAVVDPA